MRLLIRTLVLSQDFFLRILLSFVIAGCTICHPRPPNLHLDLKHVRQQEWGASSPMLEHFSWFFNIVNICSSSFIILTKLSVQREIPPEKHPIKNDLSKIWSSEKEIKDAVWGGHIPCPTISSRLCAIIITLSNWVMSALGWERSHPLDRTPLEASSCMRPNAMISLPDKAVLGGEDTSSGERTGALLSIDEGTKQDILGKNCLE
jgi:hypothetical protein